MQKPSAFAFVALLVLAGLAAVPPAQAATPSISSISPSSSDTNGGVEVTVTTTSAGTYDDGVTVKFEGRPAQVTFVAADGKSFRAIVPSRPQAATPAAPTSVNVEVKNEDGSTTTATGAFTYTVSTTPSVTSVSPTSAASTGGAILTINGAGFANGLFLPTVTVGGTPARVFLANQPSAGGSAPTATRVRVEAPAHAAGQVDVVVTNPDGKTDDLNNAVTYTSAAAPTISSLSSPSGPSNGATFVSGPTSLKVNGANFAPGAAVTFGGARAIVGFVSDDQLEVLELPAHAAGTVDVIVQNPDGRTGTETAGFIYTASAAPSWHATDPGAGASLPLVVPSVGGSLVCLRATNVVDGAKVTVGGLEASRVQAGLLLRDDDCPAAATLSFFTPQRPATSTPALGTFNVIVTNPDGRTATLNNAITVIETVAALTLSPKTGTCDGGQTVTIGGIGFVSGARVFFDLDGNNVGAPSADLNGDGIFETLNEEAADVSGSGTSITARAPPTPCGGTAVTGADVGVIVLNGDGKLTILRSAFDYTAASAAPAFASTNWVSPTSANTIGGVAATITGTGFATGPTKPSVFFDFDDDTVADPNERAIVGTVTSTSITLTVPTRPTDVATATDVNLIVVNPGGGSDVQADGFTYNPTVNPAIAHYATAPSTTTNGGNTLAIGAESGSGKGDFATGSRYDQISATNPTGAILPMVTIGGVAATVLPPVQAKSISVVLPAFTTASTGRGILVTNPNGDVATDETNALANDPGQEFVVYSNAPAPDVTSVQEGTGSTGGRKSFTIGGSNFAAGANKPIVCFGGAGDVDNNGLCDTANTQGEVTSNTASSLTVVAPARSAQGTVDLIVENPDHDTPAVQANGFNYNSGSAPSITSLSVAQAPVADLNVALKITGTGFAAANGVTATINDVPLDNVKVVSATEITGLIPGGAPGTGTVKVAHLDGTTVTSNAFRYLAAPPLITGTGATTGPSNGGTTLTLSGTGFTAGTAVFVGGAPAPFVDLVTAGTSISADSPAILVADTLAVNVAATDTNGQTGAIASAFTVVRAIQPTVRSAFPAAGAALGGTTVTITGTGFFDDDKEEPRVIFGGIDGTDVTVDATGGTITVVTPSHAQGATEVVIRNPDGQEAKLANGFTFLGAGGAVPTSSSSSSSTTTTGSGGGSTTGQTTTGPTTTGPTTTGPSTTGPTTTGPLTAPAQEVIEAANKKVRITVTREGDDNKIDWVLPAPTELPSLPILGVQLWASNSPYALVDTFPANSDAYRDGSYTHTAGDSPPAQADTAYLVTMYYGVSPEFGFYTASTAPDTDDYPRTAQAGGSTGGDGGNDLPAWAIVLILLGILFLVVLVAILIARGRNRDGGQQTAQQGYAWEQSEAKAADAEWEGGAAGEVHQARCPACATSFTATGSKPIVTVCPGCGKKGILR
jgi:hypothetical protein